MIRNYWAALCVFLLSTLTAGAQNPCDGRGPAYANLPGDTTIVLPGGTQLTFNRCEYFDLRECLELTEINDRQTMEASGLTTQDNRGGTLLTFGMVDIKLKPGCTERTCFEVPVLVRFPLQRLCAACGKRMPTLYEATPEGTWRLSNTKSRIVTVNGRDYLEFWANCPNIKYNADCRLKITKVKFKAKGWKQLDRVELNVVCPLGRLAYAPKEGRRKLRAKIYCTSPDSVLVKVRGLDSSGSLVNYERPLSALRHNRRQKPCSGKGAIKRRILGIIPVREGNYFRKYFLN